MNLTLTEIEEMTHDEIATAAARDDDETINRLGADLREAVDNEQNSDTIVREIENYLRS